MHGMMMQTLNYQEATRKGVCPSLNVLQKIQNIEEAMRTIA